VSLPGDGSRTLYGVTGYKLRYRTRGSNAAFTEVDAVTLSTPECDQTASYQAGTYAGLDGFATLRYDCDGDGVRDAVFTKVSNGYRYMKLSKAATYDGAKKTLAACKEQQVDTTATNDLLAINAKCKLPPNLEFKVTGLTAEMEYEFQVMATSTEKAYGQYATSYSEPATVIKTSLLATPAPAANVTPTADAAYIGAHSQTSSSVDISWSDTEAPHAADPNEQGGGCKARFYDSPAIQLGGPLYAIFETEPIRLKKSLIAMDIDTVKKTVVVYQINSDPYISSRPYTLQAPDDTLPVSAGEWISLSTTTNKNLDPDMPKLFYPSAYWISGGYGCTIEITTTDPEQCDAGLCAEPDSTTYEHQSDATRFVLEVRQCWNKS